MKFAAQSNKGLVRERNEDHFHVMADPGNGPSVFMVADGLGGHKNGELASRTACEHLSALLARLLPETNEPQRVREIMQQAMQETNDKVYMTSLEDDANQGMGTTLTVGALYPESFYIAHVGDSRAYLLRDGELEQITRDHTYVGEMLLRGSITEDEGRVHPTRHVLTQAIGFPEFLDIDFIHLDRLDDDRYLFCSDGLHGVLPKETIQTVLAREDAPEGICRALIEDTLDLGAPDNVTVITIFA